MSVFPTSTEFNRKIPKQKFYENLNIPPTLKRVFVEQINGIFWRNKIAATTLNIAVGSAVTEIEVFEIRLNIPEVSEALLRQIDREIPYHILFLAEFEGKYQAWIGYKEQSAGDTFKVNGYYHTDWLTEDKLPLKIEGLDLDSVYENFVRQIAGGQLEKAAPDEALKESVEREKKRRELEKKIAALQAKISKEKQFNRQVEMNSELKRLRRELEELLCAFQM